MWHNSTESPIKNLGNETKNLLYLIALYIFGFVIIIVINVGGYHENLFSFTLPKTYLVKHRMVIMINRFSIKTSLQNDPLTWDL